MSTRTIVEVALEYDAKHCGHEASTVEAALRERAAMPAPTGSLTDDIKEIYRTRLLSPRGAEVIVPNRIAIGEQQFMELTALTAEINESFQRNSACEVKCNETTRKLNSVIRTINALKNETDNLNNLGELETSVNWLKDDIRNQITTANTILSDIGNAREVVSEETLLSLRKALKNLGSHV